MIRRVQTEGKEQGAMMNPFFHTPPPSDEEERKVARTIAWVALALCAIIGLLATVLPLSA
jgi:hypothetical protein